MMINIDNFGSYGLPGLGVDSGLGLVSAVNSNDNSGESWIKAVIPLHNPRSSRRNHSVEHCSNCCVEGVQQGGWIESKRYHNDYQRPDC